MSLVAACQAKRQRCLTHDFRDVDCFQEERLVCVQRLIDGKADINEKNEQGETALEIAAKYRDHKLVSVLKQAMQQG